MGSRQDYDEQIASLEEERRLVREIREMKERRAATTLGGLPTHRADQTDPIDLTAAEEDAEVFRLANPKRKFGATDSDVKDGVKTLQKTRPYHASGQTPKMPQTKPVKREEREDGLNQLASVNDDPAYATIIKLAKAKYAEMYCCFCKGNAVHKGTAKTLHLLRGGHGIRSHISQRHTDRYEGSFTTAMVLEQCVKRTLTKKEMKAVDEGDHSSYTVPVVMAASTRSARRCTAAVPKKTNVPASVTQAGDARLPEQHHQASGTARRSAEPNAGEQLYFQKNEHA